jgi:phenylpyruvate tautomerase PptA (4-oxalocrotonate tautomerase family)
VPLIEVLAPPGDDDAADLCARISADVAEALGARPDAVWVTWSTFAHGHGVPGRLVHVHGRRTPAQMEQVRAVLERILGEDVFVTVAPVWTIDPDA